MTIYEQFKQTLFNASPELEKEIKELKFGCKIKINKCKSSYSGTIKTGYGKIIDSFLGRKTSWSGYSGCNDNISAILDSGTVRQIFSISKNNVEIIGRDITLEDVLSELWNKENNGKFEEGMGINFYQEEIQYWNKKTDTVIDSCIWQLGKPALEQREETLLSLIKLLE